MYTVHTQEEYLDIKENCVRSKIGNKAFLYDLGNGLKGYVCGIKQFKYVHGIDRVIFQPIDNDAYRAEKSKLGDDFIVEIQDWLEMQI